MVLSRILARRRIAAGVRPSFRAAWAPVVLDVVMVSVVLAALWGPLTTVIYVMELSLPLTFVVLMVAIYGPFQVVTIIATIWAVKSRWEEE
ncbi:MAG: hypothetical protein ACSHW1_08045 [Yoonia sp.]|uniref:hypothetical protein n=1 Tax=Yoonia sp. TaxID=2212373 RepID=UPI003EF38523